MFLLWQYYFRYEVLNQNLLHTVYLAIAYLALFASAEILYHKLNIQAEITRKYVHVITGLLTLLFPPLLSNHWYVLLLSGSFLIILIASLQFNFLPSINAVKRVTRGSLLYPFIVYGCFLVYTEYGHLMLYYIPILILAICDPIAALVGKKWPIGHYTTFGYTKTLSGSLGFLLMAILISLAIMIGIEGVSFKIAIITSVSVGLITVFAEAITHRGYDNLTIPASALLVLIMAGYYFQII